MNTPFFIKKSFFHIIFIYFLASCSTESGKNISGVLNLENKFNLITNEISNKNDVINLLGETLLKEYPDDKIWIYVETINKNNIFGKKKIIKNNILVLEFNSKGILASKKLIDVKNLKDLDLENTTTESFRMDSSFSKKFFASLRKRFENKTRSLASE